jgi:ABC-type branched-subunit amino acid transport system substrate-binding protein
LHNKSSWIIPLFSVLKRKEAFMSQKKRISLVLIMVILMAVAGVFAAGSQETSASEIVIGSVQDITGPTSSLGKMVDSGARLAIDEINANGGGQWKDHQTDHL